METPETLATGIVASDDERLILRPFPLIFRRRQLVGVAGVVLVVALVMATLLLAMFRPHLGAVPMIATAVVGACVIIYRVSTKVTFIARRDADGIYVETRNRLLRTTRRRLLHRYADIRGVELRTRLQYVDVVLHKRTRGALLWYTRYPECAEQIATKIASFANVSVRDSR